MGDHAAGIEAAAAHHAQVAGDVVGGLAISTVGTGEGSAQVKRESVEGDPMVVGHDADADAATEGAGEGEGLFEHGGLAGAVDDDIGGAAF